MKASWCYAVGIGFLLAGVGCKSIVTLERPTDMTNTQPQKEAETPTPPPSKLATRTELTSNCETTLSSLPGKKAAKQIRSACAKVGQLDSCYSAKGSPIFHYDRQAVPRGKKKRRGGKRILTLSLIHGDEIPSGSVARSWIERLDTLDPRNTWRVLPVVNPDGLKTKTRTNANKVDINRNFPTLDWDQKALQHWRVDKKSDPRRYPGPSGGSEIETQCLVQHIKEFKPDFIISIHTPLGLLDFDGPKKLKFPKFKPLPWISLGNFPGSLGRYSWTDRNVPVLTIELKGRQGVNRLEMFDHLQDISGTVAIQATKVKKKPHRHHARQSD